jgi:hypothetical protein
VYTVFACHVDADQLLFFQLDTKAGDSAHFAFQFDIPVEKLDTKAV